MTIYPLPTRLLRGNLSLPCAIAALVMLAALFTGVPAQAQEYYFKDGAFTSFKLYKQDTKRYGPNQHPVELEARDLEPILKAITLQAEGLFVGGDIAPLFSEEQARLLATWIPQGLRQAAPNEDILFVLERRARRLVVLSGNALTSGRVFFADNRLNIIIGEHDRARNREFERLFEFSKTVNPYDLSPGGRKRNSRAINATLLPFTGVSYNTVKGKVRDDWIVIDIPQAVAALETGDYSVPVEETKVVPARTQQENDDVALTSEEAASLHREQEAMRQEMEALREQVAGGDASSASPPATSRPAPRSADGERLPGSDIEERLRVLIRLYDDGLISEEEFNAKRREILSEL